MSSGLRHVPLHEGLVADDRSDNEARRAEDVEGGAHDGAQGSVSSKRLCSRWAYVGAATLVVFGVVVALIVALAGSKTPDGCDWDSWRLPKTFTPSAYRWTVYPEFSGDYGFNGTLEIDVTAETSNAGCVVLNAVDLDVHDASLVSGAGESVIKVTKREKRELVLVHLAKIPAKGDSLTLRLSYVRESCLTRTLRHSLTRPASRRPPPADWVSEPQHGGSVPEHVRGGGSHGADGGHAVRVHGRAPRVPVLRRAGVQGQVLRDRPGTAELQGAA